MAYDEGLAERIRDVLHERRDLAERRMFGGIAFLVAGHLTAGIIGNDLMVRVGPEQHAKLLKQPHTRPMDFSGRPMRGYLFVAAAGIEADRDLDRWIGLGLEYVLGLPAKTPPPPRAVGKKQAAKGTAAPRKR